MQELAKQFINTMSKHLENCFHIEGIYQAWCENNPDIDVSMFNSGTHIYFGLEHGNTGKNTKQLDRDLLEAMNIVDLTKFLFKELNSLYGFKKGKEKKDLPSQHQINDKVYLNFQNSGKVSNAKIIKVHFTDRKVLYDVEIECEYEEIDMPSPGMKEIARLYNIDSRFVFPAKH